MYGAAAAAPPVQLILPACRLYVCVRLIELATLLQGDESPSPHVSRMGGDGSPSYRPINSFIGSHGLDPLVSCPINSVAKEKLVGQYFSVCGRVGILTSENEM